MKGWMIGVALLVAAAVAAAAPAGQRRRISPHEETSGVVDGTRIVITYGRPSMRGRTVFGALVPWGAVWCPGADEATTLESAKPLRFGAVTVPPGPHTIWMLPTASRWTLIISREPSGFHTQYHPEADLVRVPMMLRSLDQPVEQLTFTITPESAPHGGAVTMAWEKTAVSAAFTVAQ